MKVLGLLMINEVMSITAQLCLKLGMKDAAALMRPSKAWKLALRPLLWFGGFMYVLATFLWLKILSQADLSFAYPFAALAYAGGVLASQWVLKEKVTATRWAGVALILVGLIFVASSGARSAK